MCKNSQVKTAVHIITVTAIQKELKRRPEYKSLQWASAPPEVNISKASGWTAGVFEHTGGCG